jgi:hypothetical protein
VTARDYLALCDTPPALPSPDQARRALGRHIRSAALYAEQAGRCEALAAWCREAGDEAGLLFAGHHAAWGRWWRCMQRDAASESAPQPAQPGAVIRHPD